MITLLVAVTILIFVIAIGLLAAGLIAISPVLLLLFCLPLLDYLMIKKVFGGKKKKEKE